MTTYRAIGKYEINATDAEKIIALKQAMCDAAIELVTLGVDLSAIENALEEAHCAAEDEAEAL